MNKVINVRGRRIAITARSGSQVAMYKKLFAGFSNDKLDKYAVESDYGLLQLAKRAIAKAIDTCPGHGSDLIDGHCPDCIIESADYASAKGIDGHGIVAWPQNPYKGPSGLVGRTRL